MDLLHKFDHSRDSKVRFPIEAQEYNRAFDLPFSARNYDKQYYHMYQQRMNTMKARVLSQAMKQWPKTHTLRGFPTRRKLKVLDIQTNEPCWCVGSIYCEMKYKPNILEEIVQDVYGAPSVETTYSDPENDQIMLEDESGRVQLGGDLLKNTILVSGTVVGVLGMELESGIFEVYDIAYAAPLAPTPGAKASGKIALVSGLQLDTPTVQLEMLKEYLTGELADSSSIGRLVIAGDTLGGSGVEQLQTFLSSVLQSIPVDIMPGASDPAETSLPQQPLHKALFSLTEDNNRFRTMTNPSWMEFNGVKVLGTAGQNISDVYKYVIPYNASEQETQEKNGLTGEERLDMMEATLKWQHIAPTAPDTLWCYPYRDSDPFIISEYPHVYFAGNQPEFGSRVVSIGEAQIRVIAVPKFSSTGQLVVVDLATLETEIVEFK